LVQKSQSEMSSTTAECWWQGEAKEEAIYTQRKCP
jgi:hypothetical protein